MATAIRFPVRSLSAAVWAAPFLLVDSALAKPLPEPVARMVDAAAADPETLKAVVRVAKATNPESIAEIDARVEELKGERKAELESQSAKPGFFEGWEGKGEIGGSRSSGNTDQESLALGLELEKDAPRWWHSLDFDADLQREDQEVTKERFFLSLASHYKVTRRFYVVGVLWGEGDRFAGYYSRISESLGVGYRLIDKSGVKFRIEGGPALRQADYIETGASHSASLRAAEYLSWKFAPGAEFAQHVVGYLQSGNSTLIGSAALTTKLYDSLAARASFEVRYESQPPQGRENTDTTSRLTLVYGF